MTMAVSFLLSEEFLSALLNSLTFMLIGASCVLGRSCFQAAVAKTWQQQWKRHQHIVLPIWYKTLSLWSGLQHCLSSERESPAVAAAAATPSRGGNKAALVPAEEQLTAEVALLLKRGHLLTAFELLRSVRTARGGVVPGPSCFRMLLQRLARSPSKPEILTRVTQEMTLNSLPVDPLSEGCVVRCLCRGPHADVDKAHQAYLAMLAKSVPPDLRTLECLIEACLHADRHELVKPLILALDDHGLEPSAALYAALIASCASTGAVACGMVAFDQMRAYFQADPASIQLGYSSVIYMCAQNQQLDRAVKLLAESQQLCREKGLAPAAIEARLLPPLLAAAVQTNQSELALDLAQRAHLATATAASSELTAHLDGLCKLLLKRHSSRALMTQVSAILSGASCATHPKELAVAGGMANVTEALDNKVEATSPLGKALLQVAVCDK